MAKSETHFPVLVFHTNGQLKVMTCGVPGVSNMLSNTGAEESSVEKIIATAVWFCLWLKWLPRLLPRCFPLPDLKTNLQTSLRSRDTHELLHDGRLVGIPKPANGL